MIFVRNYKIIKEKRYLQRKKDKKRDKFIECLKIEHSLLINKSYNNSCVKNVCYLGNCLGKCFS